eukprot:scaffold31709_cov41-Cyclotella_meneghiniana.AAC.14
MPKMLGMSAPPWTMDHGPLSPHTAKCQPSNRAQPTLRLAAQDLIAAIKNLINAPIDLNPKYTAALRQLADIFKDTVVEKDETTEEQSVPRVRVNNTPVPRVNTPSTSHNPKAPRVL